MRVVNHVLAFYTYKDFLSNHYPVEFRVKHILFRNCEQYIMFSKAMLFEDAVIALKILQAEHPQEMKMLGRQVKGFVEEIWVERRPAIYYSGLKYRYDQNPEDRRRLIETHPLILAEASDRDLTWGVGFKESDEHIGDPTLWTGHNLCGRAQQKLRDFYRAGMVEP